MTDPSPTDSRPYDMDVVRGFAVSALVWGVVGMSVGLLAAIQLAWPEANFGPYLHFGRIRPLHTNAVIFGFTLGTVFAGSYYASPATVPRAHVLGHAFAHQSLGLERDHRRGPRSALLLGQDERPRSTPSSSGRSTSPSPWSGWCTRVNVFWRPWPGGKREARCTSAIWFWIATILTIAHAPHREQPRSCRSRCAQVLLALRRRRTTPTSSGGTATTRSGFLLTTPILGHHVLLPAQDRIGRPIFSHRLSILHFWSLIFIYIWAGPHHLIYSPLPDWAQTFGTAFSVMLILPSWGGMLNGLLTLRGAWDKVRTDPDAQDVRRRSSPSTG